MTFDATVNPVRYEGGEPVFIDTEYDTWNMALFLCRFLCRNLRKTGGWETIRSQIEISGKDRRNL